MPKKLTQEKFIENAVAKHGEKYSYHLVMNLLIIKIKTLS